MAIKFKATFINIFLILKYCSLQEVGLGDSKLMYVIYLVLRELGLSDSNVCNTSGVAHETNS